MSKREGQIGVATAVLLLVLRLPLLVPVYASADDLVHRHGLADGELWRLYAGQGRPLQAIVYLLLRWLGAGPVTSAAMLSVVAIGLFAVSAVLLARLWELTEQPVVAVLAACLVFLHPYQMDHWIFRYMPLFEGLATVLWLYGLLQLLEGRWRGALLVVAAAAIYQTALAQLLVASIFGLGMASARGEPLRKWLRAAGAALGAGAIWIVAWRVCSGLAGLPADTRFSLFPQSDWKLEAVERVRWLISATLFDEPAFAAPLLQPLLLLLVLLLLASLALRRKLAAAGLVAVAYGAAIVTPLPLRIFWPAWRTLTPLCFFWAGVVAAVPQGKLRGAALGVAAVVLLGFAGVSAHVFDDEVRLGQRDREVASALRGRFEPLPSWDTLHTAALVGSPAGYLDLQTSNFDLNISTLGITWAATALLRESWGRPLDEPTPDERALAVRKCAGHQRWPSSDATLVQSGVAIVCF